jgi:uncharacterized protein (TIGR03083 family)
VAESVWPAVERERTALVEDLRGLTDAQWGEPSLCPGWTVHQVLAHLVASARTTPTQFLVNLAKAKFRFDEMVDEEITEIAKNGPAATLAELDRLRTSTTSPPGPKDTWLGEVIVHGEDIRRPLGIKREYPGASVTRVIDFYAGSNLLIGGKKRIAGLTLAATDADWSRGEGPVVEGPAIALLLATTGRDVALDELAGPGVDALRERMPAR